MELNTKWKWPVLGFLLGMLLQNFIMNFLTKNCFCRKICTNQSENLDVSEKMEKEFKEETVMLKVMHKISLKFKREKRRSLGRELDLPQEKIMEIETYCSSKHLDDAEVIFEILDEWKRRNGKEARREILMNAIVAVGEEDLLDVLFPKYPDQIEENQRKEYKEIEQMNWKNKILPVDEFDLKLLKTIDGHEETLGQKKKLQETFEEFSVLVELHWKKGCILRIRKVVKSGDDVITLNAEIFNQKFKNAPSTGRDECVTQDEMSGISRKIRRAEHRPLARALNLTDQAIDEIENNCTIKSYGDGEICYGILREWKQNNGQNARRDILKKALVDIKRTDVADEMYSDLSEVIDPERLKRQHKGNQERIEENQRKEYKEIELPQVNWKNKILPLEELYVDLELFKTVDGHEEPVGQKMKLQELFGKSDGKDPLRILIEGGPGFGKTTFCFKLLYDWAQHENYISTKFKMVFLFSLRYFKNNDSVEEMLKRECEATGVKGDDVIHCIKAFENETLFILDGFDEMNEECKRMFLPLLQKKKYPSVYVVVTSRKGMFYLERRNESQEAGFIKQKEDNVNTEHFWTKRVVIKGVTTDKIKYFLQKYFEESYQHLETKLNSITQGVMREVFQCPLFLILLAMMLEEKPLENLNSKTVLYKEFFNFIIRRNLIRANQLPVTKEVDIFNQPYDHVQLIDQFGRLAIDYLCENKLIFEESSVLEYCKDKVILQLGFLTKIPKKKWRERENFYQPIHKSFLEFAGAFTMWNIFKTNEHQFQRELERISKTGLKPTNDSLFYVFLGGLMNSKAYILFQSLTSLNLWFNIESLCFVNILLEINDIVCFFPSFKKILNLFIPSVYSINDVKGLTDNYFQSQIHSYILNVASERKLINVIHWNSSFCINLSQDVNFENLNLDITSKVCQIYSTEKKYSIKCKNIILHFSSYFKSDKWGDFVSLFNSIQSEHVHFFFATKSNNMNSLILELLHKELMEGQWRKMNIERLRFYLNERDDPHSLSLLLDLIRKNRVSEGFFLLILKSNNRTQTDVNILKRETEQLLNAVFQSKIIKEFIIVNFDYNFCSQFDVSSVKPPPMKSFYFNDSLNLFHSNENKTMKHSVKRIRAHLSDDNKNVKVIQNIQGMKYLNCKLSCVNSLAEMKWPGLKKVEELLISNIDKKSFQLLNSVLQLTNLQVLSFYVAYIETIASDCKHIFIELFSSLNLRICEFMFIQNLDVFSFYTECLMEGLNKKIKDDDTSTVDSQEGNTFQLYELAFWFNSIKVDSNQWKECNAIKYIKSMLQKKRLQQCGWINFYNTIKSERFEILFPPNDGFKIIYEANGMNPNCSSENQFEYRWFSVFDKFCIKCIGELQ